MILHSLRKSAVILHLSRILLDQSLCFTINLHHHSRGRSSRRCCGRLPLHVAAQRRDGSRLRASRSDVCPSMDQLPHLAALSCTLVDRNAAVAADRRVHSLGRQRFLLLASRGQNIFTSNLRASRSDVCPIMDQLPHLAAPRQAGRTEANRVTLFDRNAAVAADRRMHSLGRQRLLFLASRGQKIITSTSRKL